MAWTGHRLKAYYSAGGILWIFCGAAILILPRSMNAFMYLISVFIGIANALMTVCFTILRLTVNAFQIQIFFES